MSHVDASSRIVAASHVDASSGVAPASHLVSVSPGVADAAAVPTSTAGSGTSASDVRRSSRPAAHATDSRAGRLADRRAAAHLGDLRGSALLDALATAPAGVLREAGDTDGPVMPVVYDAPPAATDVARWWSGLGREARDRLVASAPQVMGNLEGVPYGVRDRANRAALAADLRAADAPGSTTAGQLRVLEQVRAALVRGPEDPEKQLVTLDPRGGGRAAIAMGDLDHASDVTVMVPGMFFTVAGQFVDWTATGADLYREQATVAPLAAGDDHDGVAVVAWLGYRTPDLTDVLSTRLATAGAVRLERTLLGVDATRAADPVRVDVVAHSYGSTTALLALSSGRVHVDSLTVLGSPGSAVQRASELAVPAGQVFVGEARWDPIAGTGYFGTDPAAPSFGSTVLDLDGGADRAEDGDVFRRPDGHNGYLVPGTASLHDVALIAVGRSDLVAGSGPGMPTVLRAAPGPTDDADDAADLGDGSTGSQGGGSGGAGGSGGSSGGAGGGSSGGDGSGSGDLLLLRPQDLQLRD